MNRLALNVVTRALVCAALVGAPLGAQKTATKVALDRTKVPTPSASPQIRIPTWTKTTLPNGAELVVSEKPNLPLISFAINFVGGANQYEPADKTGLASMVASMLSEGTTHRTGDQISNDLQLLGTGIGTGIGAEAGSITFLSTKDKFAPVLAVLSDELENPTFPQEALDRLRGRLIVNLTQARDRTTGIAQMVFPKLLYGNDHPYGRVVNEASLRSVTRDDLIAFHKAYFQPGHAVISVTGDITPAEAKATIEKALAGWSAGGSMPTFSYPALPTSKATTIYIVDKPGAAQSTFALGEVGPARNTPDYYALRVMNEMLGVLFQSRLNHDIREVKAYSYGVSSNFAYGHGPGAFRAGGDIVTAKTDSALIEFMKQLDGIRGPMPPTDEEMAQAKASLVQSLPEAFSSVSSVNGSIGSIYTQGLPEDYYQQFVRAVNAVTKDDVVRVAQKYIDPAHMSLLIVGDKARIEGPLEATHIAPVVVLDASGAPVGGKVTP